MFKNFEELEISNSSFKKYMDLNRFSVAIERKIAGDFKSYKDLKKEINLENLNFKQRQLLKTPSVFIKLLKQLQIVLLRYNIYLSAFKS